MLNAVETLENSAEFVNLNRTSNAEFELDPPETIGLYFRLSGVYQELFAGKLMSVQDIWSDYSNALSAEVRTVTHLAPLGYVKFAGNGCIDCGSFQICKFTKEELDSLLRNEARRIFFQWAYVDTEGLQKWSFAVVKERLPIQVRGSLQLHFDKGFKPRFSSYPAPVERVLEALALYDWRLLDWAAKEQDKPSLILSEGRAFIARPVVPFVVSVSDCLFDLPDRSPDPHAHEARVGPFRLISSDGRVPFVLDQPTTVQFAGFMTRTSQVIACARRLNTRLVDTMLGSLLKALTSHGLEELLWHVTAIEAALGENVDGGLTKLLRSRAALILGSTEAKRKAIRKRFDELYEMRCNLVHGNAQIGDQRVDFGHFMDARQFSRSVVSWVLHYMNHVHGVLEDKIENAPTREDMLKVLDMSEPARGRMMCLLKETPAGFPNVDDWIS